MNTAEVALPEPRQAAISISVVIPNYNYARFLGDAVRSALDIDWPDVEVIVVDDGSTDDSLAVLEQFRDRITVFSQENSGPREACNRGFAASHGDVIIFLDSDDVLAPSIAKELALVWRAGLSKIQTQMLRIGPDGGPLNGSFPTFRKVPSPEQMRWWLVRTSAYPTPPGSGNAYARSYLNRLFPLDDSCGDAADSACLAAAPLLGDVVTIAKPLVFYRLHGQNRSSLRADPHRFSAQILRALQRHKFALRVAGKPTDQPVPPALFRSRHLLQMRIAERRLNAGDPPLPGDTKIKMFQDTFVNVWAPGPEHPGYRAAAFLWCLATLLAPVSVARQLVHWRFR